MTKLRTCSYMTLAVEWDVTRTTLTLTSFTGVIESSDKHLISTMIGCEQGKFKLEKG